jgi:L-lactate dehydrogenase complex protein LldF
MNISSNNFVSLAKIALANEDQRAAVNLGTTTAFDKRLVAMGEFGAAHAEALRERGARAKRRALSRLPDLLEQAERKLTENGVQVLWALDGQEASQHVLDIIARHGVKRIVKSKSMVSEEIGLNHVLEGAGVEVVETDLGEFIVQLGHEPPSHIVAPVIHKSKESIRDLFVEQLGMPPTDSEETMTRFARQVLREAFLQADMGITGGNFIIAETGTLCLVTNEGNGRMVTSLPDVHVAVVGIEKIVETVEDYALLTQTLPRSATGQIMTVYTHLYNGPRREGEPDGPRHMYVILVDNGRSAIYQGAYAEALACIRCGACINACPVYRLTGGHAYGWVYPGPIGSVITPLLNGIENAKPLPHASSLCGACKVACPVDIDLPRMLLDLRSDLDERGEVEATWRLGLKLWALVSATPWLFRAGGRLARLFTGDRPPQRLPAPLNGWTRYRAFPPFAKQSFHQQWAARRGRNS